MTTRMQWTIAAMLAAGVPGMAAAQGTPAPDSAKQGTASGRAVSPRNESGDSTKSALRDEVIRNSTNTTTAPTSSGASTTGGSASADAREGAATGGAPLADSVRSMRLSRAQTRQLQEALNGAGCDAGSPDGMMGRKTRAAVACASQQKGIAANDTQALYKALGLSF